MRLGDKDLVLPLSLVLCIHLYLGQKNPTQILTHLLMMRVNQRKRGTFGSVGV